MVSDLREELFWYGAVSIIWLLLCCIFHSKSKHFSIFIDVLPACLSMQCMSGAWRRLKEGVLIPGIGDSCEQPHG